MDCCGGCGRSADNLMCCSACRLIKYCSRDCQLSHRKAHKHECNKQKKILDRREQLNTNPNIEYSCARCKSKSEIRYTTYTSASLPPVPEWVNKELCGKCCSNIGLNPPQYGMTWVYQDSEVLKRNPQINPFEGICAQCKKGGCQFKCPDCNCVLYCNEVCREAHFPKHEKKCILLQRRL